MTDRLRLLQALRDAGPTGVHSHDLRRAGISGNPSQRVIELREDGHVIEGEPERRNGRPGKRWVLTHDAAADAGATASEPVRCLSSVGRGAASASASLPAPPAGSPGDTAACGQLFDIAGQPKEAALHDFDEEAA